MFCHVTEHSDYCVTATCECHPRRTMTGPYRWVRQAVVDFHEGIEAGMPLAEYLEWRQAHV